MLLDVTNLTDQLFVSLSQDRKRMIPRSLQSLRMRQWLDGCFFLTEGEWLGDRIAGKSYLAAWLFKAFDQMEKKYEKVVKKRHN